MLFEAQRHYSSPEIKTVLWMYSFEKKFEFIEFQFGICTSYAHTLTHTHTHISYAYELDVSVCACMYVRTHRSLLHHRIILWHCVYRHLFLSKLLFFFVYWMCICFICFLAMCAVFALYSRSTNNGTHQFVTQWTKYTNSEKRSYVGKIQERRKRKDLKPSINTIR